MTEIEFWAKVDRQPEGCWPWLGCKISTGYGQVPSGSRAKPRMLAHRFAASITMGDWNPDLHTLHHCDNRPCVRPSHLFQGTDLDNVRDCISKGRFVMAPHESADRHPRAKLTDGQVKEIYIRRKSGECGAALAREFGVSDITVYHIVKRRTWKTVTQCLA